MAPSICHICLSEVGGSTGLQDLLINGVHTCAACLAVVIDKTATGDLPYPAEINKKVVDPNAYATLLDPRLLERYAHRAQEHTTHPHQRVYCACKLFVGAKVAPSAAHGAKFTAVGQCLSCEGVACMMCTTLLDKDSPLSSAINHGCENKLSATEKERLALANGPDRGKKYQTCPFCQRTGYLHDACHHITCDCSGEYCYLCGKAAKKLSGHWGNGRGQCPQFPWEVAPVRQPAQIERERIAQLQALERQEEQMLEAEFERLEMEEAIDQGGREGPRHFPGFGRQVLGMGLNEDAAGWLARPVAHGRQDWQEEEERAGQQMVHPEHDRAYFINDDGQRVLARRRPVPAQRRLTGQEVAALDAMTPEDIAARRRARRRQVQQAFHMGDREDDFANEG